MANETHAALVAEMRNRSRLAGYILPIMLARYADRLEAAHKREIEATAAKCCQLGRLAGYGASEIKHQQEPVGDAAKLREALDELVANIEMRSSTFGLNVIVDTKTYLDAKAALAAPPRNCDVGTAEEQYKRFMNMCNSKDVRQCAECSMRGFTPGCSRDRCFANWAQMPYEEGGAK